MSNDERDRVQANLLLEIKRAESLLACIDEKFNDFRGKLYRASQSIPNSMTLTDGGVVVLRFRSFPPARGRRGHGRNMGELYCGQNFGWGAKVGRRVTGVYVLANPFRSLAPGRVS